MRALLPFVVAAAFAACGGIVVFDESGRGDDGPSGSGGDDGPTATSVASTSGVANGGGSASSGAGPARIEACVEEVGLGANCMPAVGPDPIAGTVIIEYRNVGGAPGSATIDRADLFFTTPSEGWAFALELEPRSSGTIGPGETVSVVHAKVATPGDASFVCSLCSFEGSIQIAFAEPDVPGVIGPAVLACAF